MFEYKVVCTSEDRLPSVLSQVSVLGVENIIVENDGKSFTLSSTQEVSLGGIDGVESYERTDGQDGECLVEDIGNGYEDCDDDCDDDCEDCDEDCDEGCEGDVGGEA